jgi:hypothetical protein
MMDGDLGGKFGSCVAFFRVSLVFQNWDAQQAQSKAQSLIVACYGQVGI